MKTCWMIIAFLFTSLFSNAQAYKKHGIDTSKGKVPGGLPEGIIAPDFRGTDQKGNKFHLHEATKQQPVVLIFYRGHWCPVCNRHLGHFQDSLGLITKKGARVVAVTPQKMEYVDKTSQKHAADFSIIPDTTQSIMEAYKVDFDVTGGYTLMVNVGMFTNIAKTNDQEEAVLPVPATYIIGKNQHIIYRQFDVNYKNRASVKNILEALAAGE